MSYVFSFLPGVVTRGAGHNITFFVAARIAATSGPNMITTVIILLILNTSAQAHSSGSSKGNEGEINILICTYFTELLNVFTRKHSAESVFSNVV